MDDDALLALAQEVLDQHFGLMSLQREAVCATCLTVAWPCPPARLAEHTKREVLSR